MGARLHGIAFLAEIKQKVSHALATVKPHQVYPVNLSYVLLSEIDLEPISYGEDVSSQYHMVWLNAMKTKFDGLQMVGTCSADPISPRRKPVPACWILQ